MKLVREKTAFRIAKENPAEISTVSDVNEYDMFLKLKLSEEMDELKKSKFTDISEYADVLEVLHTLMNSVGISWSQVIQAKDEKLEREGGFSSGYIWKNNQR